VRKVLLFLLLFGGGLLVLWQIENSTANGGDPKSPQGGDATLSPTDLPSHPGMQLGGAFNVVLYHDDTSDRGRERVRRAFLRVRSQESRTEGEIDWLKDVRIEMFDPSRTEEVKQADLVAESAQLTRQETGNDRELRYENRALLRSLQATFLREVFLAPLVFEAPEAMLDALDPGRRRLESSEAFAITSPRLDAGGTGIIMHLDEDLLEVREKGWLVFHGMRQGGAEETPPPSARFSSEEHGAFQVRTLPGTVPKSFIIKAWDGTRLDISGERPALLTARETTLRASAKNTGEMITLDNLDAHGNVRIKLDDNIFEGNTASIRFDAEGAPLYALLRGLPRSIFPLPIGDVQRELSDDASEDPDAVRVDVSGTDALEVRWENGYHVTLVGPSTLETRGLGIRAAQGLTGFRSPDGRTARFSVTGGVYLETDQGTLETEKLDIDIDSGPRGEVIFKGRASNGARIVGALQDGRRFTAATPETMTLIGSPSGWLLKEGTLVEISVADPEGFFARADRVENVDLQSLSLKAFGNVHYSTTSVARAYVLDTDALKIASEREEISPDTVLQHFVVEAEGNVNGTIGAQGRTDTIACTKLVAVQTQSRRGQLTESTSRLSASGKVETNAVLRHGKILLKAEEVQFDRKLRGTDVVEESLVAEGEVEFEGERGFPFSGTGDRLVLNEDRVGKLIAHRGRVSLESVAQTEKLPFRMTADEVTFTETEVFASEPAIQVAGYRARGKSLTVLEDSIELNGDVRVSGFTPRNTAWTLAAERLRIEGRAVVDPSGRVLANAADVRGIYAYENVQFRLKGILRADGDSFVWKKIYGTMRLEGSPLRAFSSVAQMETEWIEFDPSLHMITGTGPGKVTPLSPQSPPAKEEKETSPGVKQVCFVTSTQEPRQQQTLGEGTVLEFLSTSTQVDVEKDSLVFLIQEPVFHSPDYDTTLRASWAVFWIDREGWIQIQDDSPDSGDDIVEGLRQSVDKVSGEARARGPLSDFIEGFRAGPLAGLLREVYFEGPVEFIERGNLLFRANAVYLDAVLGQGWLAQATVNLYGRLLGKDFEKLIVKADWLRHADDGSLRADDATVTSCQFDDPHLKVVTGDLRILPLAESKEAPGGADNRALFRLVMKNNRIELYDKLRIPLPTIDLKTDDNFRPLWNTLSLANSARFGTFLSLGASVPAGKTGEIANDLLSSAKENPYDATFEIEGSYLGSRGALLDLGMEIESKENYFFNLYTGIIYDRGEDRGFIRVPKEDRGRFRYWLRSLGYFERGDSALSLTVSNLSDAAVQSEFYERDFLYYERDETYLQWHRSKGEWFSQITIQPRIDDFRSDIEELPSSTAFHSRAPAFYIGKQPIIWVGDARVGYLRRLEADGVDLDIDSVGNPSDFNPSTSPFGLPPKYPDHLGERRVLRIDTTQVLESPFSLKIAGLRMTPFIGARGTFWNEGVEPGQSPTRAIAGVGTRLTTSFWRRNGDGTRNQFVPYLGFRSDIFRKDEDMPVVFDQVEQVLTGDFIELGTRGRFGLHQGESLLDLDLRSTYAMDRSDGAPDGWMPLEAFTRIDISPWGRPFGLWYDARYDIEDSRTDYSLVSLGTRFGQRFGLQAGHRRGRKVDGESLFEAATLEAFFRWTEKWEFEASQAFSLLDDRELDLRVLVRRYGHDVILDMETAVREGEGTSFGISIQPRFGYNRRPLGYVPW